MGCGASKNIAVKDAPVESPAAAKPAVIVVAASTPAVQKKAIEPHAALAAAEDQAISVDETPAPAVRAASPAPSIRSVRSVKNEADVKPNNVVAVRARRTVPQIVRR